MAATAVTLSKERMTYLEAMVRQARIAAAVFTQFTQEDVDSIVKPMVLAGLDHAQNLARSVTDALQQIALEHGVPVINAVLSMEIEAQARERCLGSKINRGAEAARAAVQIAEVMRGLRRK